MAVLTFAKNMMTRDEVLQRWTLTKAATLNCVVAILTWILAGQVVSKTIGTERFPDKTFPSKTLILNQTVTCGQLTPGKFVAPTYSCSDLRVDGSRLAYGYYFGWAVGQDDQRCQETSGVHEFAQLCLLLLKSINVDKLGFKAVYIPKSTCAYINETRRLLKRFSDSDYRWTNLPPGWGWTETIQCMTDYPS
ncbi:unnamed protein product [Lymnaea stagnalis]|uniref:Uncharacterized protein n=1 Tax=Lymnaea stagnalis TaxID=6523 RepID=A0AAV2HLI3_LYMST